MTEREKLVKAINRHDDAVARCGKHVFDADVHVVVDAARKHLETLPKTKSAWRVTGLRADGTKAETIAYTNRERALDGARVYMVTGYRDVNLVNVEVPA